MRSPIIMFPLLALLALTSPTLASEQEAGARISEARLVLPAVKGNPGAAYFTLANGTSHPLTIASAQVKGAGMAMFHETMDMGGHSMMHEYKGFTVKPGQQLVLEPGHKHLMVEGLPALKQGDTTTLRITFADGGKLETALPVLGPGGMR